MLDIPFTRGELARVEEREHPIAYRSPLLREHEIPHLFTTRRDGNGRLELDAGDLDPSARAILIRLAGMAEHTSLARAHQVHGDGVAVLDGPASADGEPCADALVTSCADRALVVSTADCVPILVARADGRRVAAIHAGWRGLVAGVIPRALEQMGGGELVAAVGPCLSLERFEVGVEVAARFRAADLAGAVQARAGARPHVDLRIAACLQLERAGIARIDVSDRCTWDDPELWSHRRDVTHGGKTRTGRLGALIARRGAG